MLNETELSSQSRLGCLCGDQVCFGCLCFGRECFGRVCDFWWKGRRVEMGEKGERLVYYILFGNTIKVQSDPV